uniref:Peptidase S1 domain-containing protein n=1 Tax=Stomoxys calcitrans TaxID=35570 RepID=A0A1I8P0Q6_STOCA
MGMSMVIIATSGRSINLQTFIEKLETTISPEVLNRESVINLSLEETAKKDKDFDHNSTEVSLEIEDKDTTEIPVEEPLKNDNESRINGGFVVQQIVPYQVSLQSYRSNRWQHFCGGSILTPHHVITAAHCTQNMRPEDIHVVAGTLTWKQGGDRHRVLSKREHPRFSSSPKLINDVAILKVSPPFNLHKPTVGTIGWGSRNRVGESVNVGTTGWGATTPTLAGGLAHQLQRINYKTLSNAECSRKGFRVTDNEICALLSKGRGSCMGDSGGPLVTTQNPPQLVGIMSYGTIPCAAGKPDVYSRVSSFLPYINQVISTEIP